LAVRPILRTWREQRLAHAHDQDHHHDHGHDHAKSIDTGHGVVRLEVFEDGVPHRFRLYRESSPPQPTIRRRTKKKGLRQIP
jgi:hypothetical protein